MYLSSTHPVGCLLDLAGATVKKDSTEGRAQAEMNIAHAHMTEYEWDSGIEYVCCICIYCIYA